MPISLLDRLILYEIANYMKVKFKNFFLTFKKNDVFLNNNLNLCIYKSVAPINI